MDNQNPNVFYTPEALRPQTKSWFKPKFIFIALLAVVAIEIVLAVKTLLTPIPHQKVSGPAALTDASLSLQVSKAVASGVKVGDNFTVGVILSTGGHRTVGTDVVLRYDPAYLEASTSVFTKGIIYSDYPSVSVDNKAGVIRASGIVTSGNVNFGGEGPFGKLLFKAAKVGKTTISSDFTKGLTTDSNVTEVGTLQDVLGKVNNLEINIQ